MENKKVKKVVLDILKSIIEATETGDWSKVDIDNIIAYSPAGDGYGCDNHFIDFNYAQEIQEPNDDIYCGNHIPWDISDVLWYLQNEGE